MKRERRRERERRRGAGRKRSSFFLFLPSSRRRLAPPSQNPQASPHPFAPRASALRTSLRSSRWPLLCPPRAACPRAALVRNQTARGSERGSMHFESSCSCLSFALSLSLLASLAPPGPLLSLVASLLSSLTINSRLSSPSSPLLPTPHSLAQVRRPGCPPRRRQGLCQVRQEPSRLARRAGAGRGSIVFFFALWSSSIGCCSLWRRPSAGFSLPVLLLPSGAGRSSFSEALRFLRGLIPSPVASEAQGSPECCL